MDFLLEKCENDTRITSSYPILSEESHEQWLVRTRTFRSRCQFVGTSIGNGTPCRMTCTTAPADLDRSSDTEVFLSLSEAGPMSGSENDHPSLETIDVDDANVNSLTDCVSRLDRSVNKSLTTSMGSQSDLGGEQKVRKKMGGWPKGKKRKADTGYSNAPKAPSSGYILFLNERRKYYKETRPDVQFADVTKMIGNEWTNLLPADEKKKYLNLADADKKRYLEELQAYRQTDYYQAVNKNKLPEAKSSVSSEHVVPTTLDSCGSYLLEPCSELTIDLGHDDEKSDELYCQICDQLFNSLHNKKEHLYGRSHLLAMTNGMSKAATGEDKLSEPCETQVADCPYVRLTGSSVPLSSVSNPVASNVNQAIHDFFEITMGRAVEIGELKKRLVEYRRVKERLQATTNGLKLLESSLLASLTSLKSEETSLKDQLANLRMVPALFGVINFQHQT